jgi:CubicO group peptidase (beta-lactamase class C family)
MKPNITFIFLLIVQLALGQDRVQKIDSLLMSLYNTGKINGNVLIAEKGKVIYSRSFGLANETTKEELNENSVFGLASVSKQFTAMAIVILKDQGKLNYDDKITKYLPELTAYDDISIRNLLNHTSGLIPNIDELKDTKEAKEYLATNLDGNWVTNKDVVAFLSMYKPTLRFRPNEKWEYCNTGYVLLGSIIEKVTGLTYAEYLDQVIFKPLEMNNTYVYSLGLIPDKINNRTYDYIYSDSLKRFLSVDSMINKINVKMAINGGGSLYSTVTDLLKWDRALYTDKLVSYTSLKEIFEPAILSDKTKTSYGFGWYIQENPNYGKFVAHDGKDRGYLTYIVRQIDHDKTIIILENYSPGMFPIDAINHILYDNITLYKEITLTNEQLQKLVGTYEIQKGVEVKISLDKGQLIGQVTGQIDYALFPESELLFFLKEVDAKLQFEKNKSGEIQCLYILQGGNKTKAVKKK